MDWLKTLLYGLISGMTEILPVSSGGHQVVFRSIFGDNQHFGIYNIFVHIGVLLALTYACKPLLDRIRNVRVHSANRSIAFNDRRVIKDATPPFIIVSIIIMLFCTIDLNLLWVAALFILNGIILFIPSRIAHGNKDARSMSAMDSVLIGLFGAFSVFPGLSRTGIMTTIAAIRGSDRQHAIIWALVLSVPALLVLIVADVYLAIINGISFYFSQFLNYLLSMAGGFCGGCIAVRGLRRLAKSVDFTLFAYYLWGMAMLTFILFLMI